MVVTVTGALNTGYIADDARSHVSQFSTRSRSRSEHGLFGQSNRYPSRNGESLTLSKMEMGFIGFFSLIKKRRASVFVKIKV